MQSIRPTKVPQLARARGVVAAASMFAIAACSSTGNGAGLTPLAAPPSSIERLSIDNASKAELYITDDGTNAVDTFAWPKPKSPTGELEGFSEPQLGCADQSGDVFISNTGDENILEYDGSEEVNTLNDSGEYPTDCSFDTANGDLAVSNIVTTKDGPGKLAIYKNAKGTPQYIAVPGVPRVSAVQYDGSGNLFVAGDNSSSDVTLVEMKAGSDKFKVACPKLIGGSGAQFLGGLAWDGKYIVITTNEGLLRINNCKVVGAPIVLTGSSDIAGFAIAGNRLVGADAGNADVEIYAYPKGGKPIQTLTGFSEPIGAVISDDAKKQ
jgi:hypothetical protein